MGFLRDLQRRVDEDASSLLLLSSAGPAGGAAGPGEAADDGGSAAPGSTKRAPFAASRGGEDAGGEARPAGSRYYTPDTGRAEPVVLLRTPMWLTALNVMNGVLGAGIVGLPYALYQSGACVACPCCGCGCGCGE